MKIHIFLLLLSIVYVSCTIHTRISQYSTKAQNFESDNLKSVHPLLSYRVTNNNGHVLKDFMHESGHHTNSYTYSEHEPKVYLGLNQPYPDKIHVHFTAYNTVYDLELSIMHQLYEPFSKYIVKNSNDEVISEQPHTLRSYWTRLSDSLESWATVTLHDDGRFSAVIHKDGDTLQVDPVETHSHEMEKHVFSALKTAATKGMTIFKHSDLTNMEKTHLCGAAPTSAAGTSLNASKIEYHPQVPTASHLRKLLTVDKWTNCYPGDNTGHRASVGVMADAGYYAAFGSESGVNSQIASLFSSANAVYLQQLNVFLTVSETIIYSSTGGSTPAFNRAPPPGGRCSGTTIDSTLSDFSSWRYNNRRTSGSIWHLLTNCFPPAGTVGLAWIGTLCSSRYGNAVTSQNRVTWLTVAHEIGHNFGASHTFQLGQGSTGGIMDYGDGRLPPGSGDYQFNTVYSKDQMCKMMTSATSISGFSPYCWGAYGAVCGNGIVESGEDCDDTSGCCDSNCRLKSTSQCSGNTECCQSCKYTASSTTCKNGGGFCKNGQCVDSTCSSFSNLKFCGMKSDNPCRQQCKDTNNVCSDSYTTPNLNVPDGTVCKLSPYTTCTNGQCGSAPVVTYSWSTGGWSDCNCNGVQSRSVTCKGSDSSVADWSKCTGSTPSATSSCTVPTSCQTYSWNQFVPWGTCSQSCGGGTQTRTAQCIGSMSTAPVSNSFCTSTPPATTQSCNTSPCPSNWNYGSWSACSASCGGGTSTRTATCQMTQNGVTFNTDDGKCSASSKGSISQSCNTQACTTYSIQYGNWGSCSSSCGTGVMTRSWSCVASTGGTVNNNLCTGTSSLQTSQSCNTQACAVYDWKINGWTACSATCGGGTQTRTVTCINTVDGSSSIENNCKITKPTTIQSCATDLCTTYIWATSRWGPCGKACGAGDMSRSVACVNQRSYSVVADSFCGVSSKPPTNSKCNEQSCSTFSWLTGDWSSCSATCGTGIQTRSLSCTAAGSRTALSMTKCDLKNIPATAQYCNSAPCRYVVKDITWDTSDWSNCTQICGTGQRSRIVRCINNITKEEIPEETCLNGEPMPDTTGECGVEECPVFWWTGEFGECSQQCGGTGTQTRTVECRLVSDPLGAPVGDERCYAQKPSTIGSCNLHACPTWEVSQWSNCSAKCNDGVQTRTMECVTHEGLVTTDEKCSTVPVPSLTQPCNVMPCPHWHLGLWSPCSRPCTSGNLIGEQTRDLVCRMPHDGIWMGRKADDESLCPPNIGVDGDEALDGSPDIAGGGRPATKRQCNTNPCADYYWMTGQRTECSKTCGGGIQTATLSCIKNSDNSVVSDNLCVTDKPTSSWSCNTDPCPNYEWFAMSSWSECNVFCGSGYQTRDVRCRDTNPNPIVGIPYELVDDSHCSPSNKPDSVQTCKQSTERCQNPDFSGRINGRCVSGTCECRSGYSGQNCTIIPKLTEVDTNSAYYSSGLPLNERLEINWKTIGSIDFVSLLLIKDDKTWPFGQYIAQDIVNVNSYVWQIGEKLKDIEAGTYRIRVWFSNTVYGDSDEFVIADPCAYQSCGVYGVCASGECQCLPGYTGPTCAIGPCQRAQCGENSQCNNGDFITSMSTPTTMGICNCTNGFTGSQCKTPPGCEAKCLNGGDYTATVIRTAGATTGDDCGICGCANRWTGSTCATCPIQCFNGGTVDKDCTTCNCPANSGYFGPTCECRYYELTIRLNMKEGIDWLNNPTATNRFKRSLATDIAIAAGDAARAAVDVEISSVTVDKSANTPNILLVVLRLSLPCIVTSRSVVGYNGFENAIQTNEWGYASSSVSYSLFIRDVRKWQPLMSYPHLESSGMHVNSMKSHFKTYGIRTREQIISVNTISASSNENISLLGVYNLLSEMFSNTDSPIYHGVVTSNLDQSYILQVRDPTGMDSPSSPEKATDPFGTIYDNPNGQLPQPTSGSSSGLSGGAIAGIVIGVTVGVILFVSLLYYRYSVYKRQEHKSTTHEIALEATDFTGTGPSSSQMKEPPTPATPATPYESQTPGERTLQYAPTNEPIPLR